MYTYVKKAALVSGFKIYSEFGLGDQEDLNVVPWIGNLPRVLTFFSKEQATYSLKALNPRP